MEWRREPVDVGEVIDRATAATASLLDDDRAGHGRRRRAPGLPAVDRRPRPAHPGRHQPDLERGQVHARPARSPCTRTASTAETAGRGRRHASPTPAIGIAPEDQERVFEQFGQAGDTLTDKPRGTGLGPARSAARSSSTTAAGSGSSPRSGGRDVLVHAPVAVALRRLSADTHDPARCRQARCRVMRLGCITARLNRIAAGGQPPGSGPDAAELHHRQEPIGAGAR